MANAGFKSILTVLIALAVPRISLAQSAHLELIRQGRLFCPAEEARINVGFLNRTGVSQTIPASTRMSMVFSFPVIEVPFNPSGVAFGFSGNTLTAEFLTSVTVENESGVFFNSVSLNMQSATSRTPVVVTVIVDPLSAVTFAQSNTAIEGLADPAACQPAAQSAFTVEDLTSGCPTATEVAAFRAAVDLRLDSDPSAGTLVCRAADGSADLTRLEERTFQAFRIMQFLPFDAPLPWTSKPLYDWFRGAIRGIRYRSDIPFSFCCDPTGYINIQTGVGVLAFPTNPEAVISLADLLIHEARHNDGLPHTCGTWDQTLPELGAWGAVFYYNEWAAFRTGDFLKSKTPGRSAFYWAWTWGAAQAALTTAICDHGGGVVVSPTVLDFGAQKVGVASAPRTLAITQTEGGPVTISGVSLEGVNAADFTVTSPPCTAVTLPPSCAAVVRFAPLTTGLRSAQLRVTFSGSGTQRTVTLSGTGVAGSICTYVLSSLGQSIEGNGGFGTVAITAADGCNWEAASDTQWLSIASGRVGAGNGTLAFVATPNPSTAPRIGTLTIAGQIFSVVQAAPCTYALSAGGQAFPPAGGSGSISITAPQECAWNISSLSGAASAVTFISSTRGSGNGTISYQVAPNAGVGRAAAITVAGLSFTIEQQAAFIPSLYFVGSMPHIAAQENWTTTFTLVNKAEPAALARIDLFGDPSGLLTLPLVFPQQPPATGPLLAASLDRMLAANASLVVSTAGPQTSPVLVGSAQLAATGSVDGFAIFHHATSLQEAVVPMETRNASSYLLAFDNVGGLVLGVAVENVSAQSAVIPVVIRDDTGTVISTPGANISLGGNGHTAFVLSDPAQGFPVTANKRGTIEFDTPPGGHISVLGIRFTPLGPGNALTTIPALANVGTNGGIIAHFASGGDGWQTTFVLVNAGASAAQATLSFFSKTGNPLPLPLSYPQLGGDTDTVAPSLTRTLAAGATLLIQSSGAANLLTGSAQLSTTGHVSGFVIFRHNGQEAVVPLESRNASSYILAFDNTAGTFTGVAVSAVPNQPSMTQPVNIQVVVRNEAGTQIGGGLSILAANGQSAFTLAVDKFPETAGIRGTIEFETPPNFQIGVLGIRIPIGVAHTFTTLPALAR